MLSPVRQPYYTKFKLDIQPTPQDIKVFSDSSAKRPSDHGQLRDGETQTRASHRVSHYPKDYVALEANNCGVFTPTIATGIIRIGQVVKKSNIKNLPSRRDTTRVLQTRPVFEPQAASSFQNPAIPTLVPKLSKPHLHRTRGFPRDLEQSYNNPIKNYPKHSSPLFEAVTYSEAASSSETHNHSEAIQSSECHPKLGCASATTTSSKSITSEGSQSAETSTFGSPPKPGFLHLPQISSVSMCVFVPAPTANRHILTIATGIIRIGQVVKKSNIKNLPSRRDTTRVLQTRPVFEPQAASSFQNPAIPTLVPKLSKPHLHRTRGFPRDLEQSYNNPIKNYPKHSSPLFEAVTYSEAASSSETHNHSEAIQSSECHPKLGCASATTTSSKSITSEGSQSAETSTFGSPPKPEPKRISKFLVKLIKTTHNQNNGEQRLKLTSSDQKKLEFST
ncbi:hypothetical protein LXL04_003419 [Taraxacum kok-saghyz]